jgi:hypothetical protein
MKMMIQIWLNVDADVSAVEVTSARKLLLSWLL